MQRISHMEGCSSTACRPRVSSSAFAVVHRLRPSGPIRRTAVKVAAAAATASIDFSKNGGWVSYNARESRPEPAKLPPPPKSGEDLTHVLPYILKLALAEKQQSWRLGAALALMLVSKAAGISAPLFLKAAVDTLSASGAAVLPALRCVLLFGLCGIIQQLTKELCHPTFTPISQAVARRVAYQTFSHVLELDITFHMNRRTGRLSRILERGTRSIQMLYRAVLFTFAPTFIELVFVISLLATQFSPMVAMLVAGTFLVYVTWTLTMTQAAVEVRKQVNQLDNLTTSKAVDALLNAETVALFGNRQLEVNQYDHYLRGYQAAAIQTERLAAVLNAGQSIILSAGLTCCMVAAVIRGPVAEAMAAVAAGGSVAAAATAVMHGGAAAAVASPGDLVLLQGLLLQLWSPLQFLGWFYRELRQSLVDMEEFFDILKTENSLPDGTIPLPDVPPCLTQFAPAAAAGAALAAPANGSQTSSQHQQQQQQVLTSAADRSVQLSSIDLSSNSDKQSLVEAALLLERHHHPKEQQPGHNLGSADLDYPVGPDPSVCISGLGLEVELQDVKFGYHAERQVLKGVSFKIMPGESIAVVGASGSGKSTILKLITRLYDAVSGQVKVNGVDVKDVQTAGLRQAVAVVPQDTVLFNDTILQNIRYGKPTASDEEVIRAAQLAHLHEAVLRMPDGYTTMVGERGLKLSGGEKQRVAIARAFLRAPRLLICDEATSALDTATEASILASLDELARGRTSIFVAHRLSTIAGCDRILVLSEGKLVEEGSHTQLLSADGVYAGMWRKQAQAKTSESKMESSAEEDSEPLEPLPQGLAVMSGQTMRS